MDGTDADGEWSDEEVLQSGSQTGLSETEAEDVKKSQTIHITRPRPPFRGHPPNGLVSPPMSQFGTTRAQDPVSQMMDRIDAELEAIAQEELKVNCGYELYGEMEELKVNCGYELYGEMEELKVNCGYELYGEMEELKVNCRYELYGKMEELKVNCGCAMYGKMEELKVNCGYELYGKMEELKVNCGYEFTTSWPKITPETPRSADHNRSRSSDALYNDLSNKNTGPPRETGETSMKLLGSILPQADRKDMFDPRTGPVVPRELDPMTAQEIDARFKEIMSKKKDHRQDSGSDSSKLGLQPGQRTTTPVRRRVTIMDSKVQPSSNGQGRQLESLLSRLRIKNSSRPSAVMLSTGYATDNESVKTEDFESKFLSLMVNPSEADRRQTFAKFLEDDQTRRPATDEAPHTKLSLSRPRSCSPARVSGVIWNQTVGGEEWVRGRGGERQRMKGRAVA
ncbi:hypothetical protein Btru_002596 [Bulinus truncatus]|nr:hypothetical protein Btru_002596 [Bulinus truncatus]